MGEDFRFTSCFVNNAVFIIDGLKTTDLQTGLKLHDMLRDMRDYEKVACNVTYLRVTTRIELLSALEKICDATNQGIKPIIHFECHGDSKAGLTVGDGEDIVSWDELEAPLRSINLASGCNLGVIMAVCFGLYAITPIKIVRAAPFYFLLGSDTALLAGKLSDEMPAFYRVLFKGGSLDEAISEVSSCKPFHAEKLLAVSFAKYLKQSCTGKGRAKRVELLVTSSKQLAGIVTNRANLRKLRKYAKQFTKADNNAPAFIRCIQTFLPGRTCSFTFKDLMNWVQSGSIE